MWTKLTRRGSSAGFIAAWVLALLVLLAPMWWLFGLFEHFRLYFGIGCVAVAAMGLFHRFRWRLALLTGLTAFFLYPLWPYYFGETDAAPAPGEKSFRAMVLNVLFTNTEKKKVLDLIRVEKPDLLLLIEIDEDWADSLKELSTDYPYGVLEPRPGAFGIWLLSKYPLESTSVHVNERDEYPMIQADVDFGDRVLHVMGAHPIAPIGGADAGLQASQISEIAHRMVVVKKPKMLLGDFNVTPWSGSFEKLASVAGVRDSALGRGIDSTWGHRNFPFLPLPLDHCLVCESVRVFDRHVSKDVGSDHRGVVVTFSLPEAPAEPAPPSAKPVAEETASVDPGGVPNLNAGSSVK